MVKKKTRRKIIKPPQPKLDTVFNCPKCDHKKTVAVTFNRKEKTGTLICKNCRRTFETTIRSADAYIDVYYKWIDELEKKENKSSSESEEENEQSKNEYEEEHNSENKNEENEDENEENSYKEDNDRDNENEEEEGENENDNENDNDEENENDDENRVEDEE